MSADARATTHALDEITFMFAGAIIEHGRDDNFLQVAQEADDFGYKGGVDGEGVFFKMGVRYTKVTVTLMATAAGNGVLYAIHAASLAAGGLPAPIFYEDRRGASKLTSGAALILKTPDETFAVEPGTTVWVFGVHNPARIVGGH